MTKQAVLLYNCSGPQWTKLHQMMMMLRFRIRMIRPEQYHLPLEQLAQGHDLILEIDVQGCLQAMKQNPDATGVFICPPSRENLEKRLRNRGTETEESIRVRLGNVAGEISQAYKYDYVIIHQDWADVPNALDVAADELYAIITARRLEKDNRVEFLDQLSASLRK